MESVFWAVILGALALALMFLGGLTPLQTAATAGSLPTMIIILIKRAKELEATSQTTNHIVGGYSFEK